MAADGTTADGPRESIAAGRPPPACTAAVATMMRRGGVPGLSMAVVNRDGVLARRRLRHRQPCGEHAGDGLDVVSVVLHV